MTSLKKFALTNWGRSAQRQKSLGGRRGLLALGVLIVSLAVPLVRLPDEVWDLHLRVGLVPGADHCQLQLEVTAPRTQELLAMTSRPHVRMEDLRPEVESLADLLCAYADILSEPF